MRIVSAALCFLLLFGFFLSCTREKSFELGAPASGSLQSEGGDCLPKTAVGAFIAGKALTDSNYLDVQVNVSTPGTYNIHTDTTNGYSFSGIGSFDHAGINDIHLTAIGTPVVSRQDSFTVIFDTSFCFVQVSVLPPGSLSGPATFTLQGSGDTCMISNVSGTYTQNTQLTASSTVAIQINATTLGTYSLTTNTVSGFQFSGAGTIATAGQQTITLTASGTPSTSGPVVFTVSAGGTTCTFTVNVNASTGPPPATGDLFPLKTNDWWSYLTDVSAPNDTFTINDAASVAIAGKTYDNLQLQNGTGVPYDTGYYRKNDTGYYKLVAFDSTTIPGLQTPIAGDVLFLKDNPNVGDTWTTQADAVISGQSVKLQVAYTCADANTTEMINGHSFTGVYKITSVIQVVAGGVPTDLASEESHYARGVGLIYQKAAGGTYGTYERQIKSWNVQ